MIVQLSIIQQALWFSHLSLSPLVCLSLCVSGSIWWSTAPVFVPKRHNFFLNFITCSVTFFSIIDFRHMESRIHFQRNYAGFRNRSWGFHLVDNILLNMLLGFFLDNLMTCIVWINIHIHFFFLHSLVLNLLNSFRWSKSSLFCWHTVDECVNFVFMPLRD